MRGVSIRTLVLVLSCVGAWPRVAGAQAGRAELTGEIRDEAGATVPGAQVTVTELSTSQAVTDSAGANPKRACPPASPHTSVAACSSQARPSSHWVADRFRREAVPPRKCARLH